VRVKVRDRVYRVSGCVGPDLSLLVVHRHPDDLSVTVFSR
jgi:hypothetical protein